MVKIGENGYIYITFIKTKAMLFFSTSFEI